MKEGTVVSHLLREGVSHEKAYEAMQGDSFTGVDLKTYG